MSATAVESTTRTVEGGRIIERPTRTVWVPEYGTERGPHGGILYARFAPRR